MPPSKATQDQPKDQLHVFANREGVASALSTVFGPKLANRKAFILVVTDNAHKSDAAFNFPELQQVKRAIIVFEGRPIHLDSMNSWRNWAMEKMPKLFDLRMAFVEEESDDAVKNAVNGTCCEWFALPPAEESDVGIAKASWVQMPTEATRKDDPSLLTMMFGSMGELLTGLEVAARSFRSAIGSKGESNRETYLKAIDGLLAGGSSGSGGSGARPKKSATSPNLGIGNITDRLPKVLLLGETGVGKTLIASYLQERSGFKVAPLHVSIPEFIGKEDALEYKLFGYVKGDYTHSNPDGDHGLLLHNVCRVVFLDEIGEANAEIQAKLLTFLDHFQVRPRGWLGDPFYCPVMIVAATNRNLRAKTCDGERAFRNDLFQRFTDVLRIPPLRERKQDFEFIFDCLLQRESMNPENCVTRVGADALKFLKGIDFEEGNFRELEDLFRVACRRAFRDDRRYLVKADFEKTT